MNRLELRKMSLEFRRLSSNLLNSTDDTADINLSRFLKFINGNPPEDEACHIKAQYDYLLFINNEDKVNVRGQAMRYCWSSKKLNDNIQSFLDMAFKPLIDCINDYLSMEMIVCDEEAKAMCDKYLQHNK